MKDSLMGLGYAVVGAGSAGEALALLRSSWFDLLIADLDLPDTTGLELTRQVRHGHGHGEAPIVLMATEATVPARVACLDAGADDILDRAIDVDELHARVRMHLRRGERQNELVLRNKQDGLTGLWNRAAIEEELGRTLRQGSRTGLPTSVLMIDIDGFKAINDTFGHALGDVALRAVGARLVVSLRDTDRVGRFGGDEFLVLLPGTGRRATRALVDRLRWRWSADPVEIPFPAHALDISIGAATAEPGESVEDLVRRSDLAMYANKQRTRGAQEPTHGARPALRSSAGDGLAMGRPAL